LDDEHPILARRGVDDQHAPKQKPAVFEQKNRTQGVAGFI